MDSRIALRSVAKSFSSQMKSKWSLPYNIKKMDRAQHHALQLIRGGKGHSQLDMQVSLLGASACSSWHDQSSTTETCDAASAA